MAPKEDDLTRLKILLASGLSITEAAKRMDVSRSTAQRLKKKIVEISDFGLIVMIKGMRAQSAAIN